MKTAISARAARSVIPPAAAAQSSLRLIRYQSTASGYSSTSSKPSEQEVANARRYCMDLLQSSDAPSYTLLAFIPPHAQTAYLAIRAFNIEIARIADTASTPQVATMRLAFWRDAVKRALEGSPPKQPVSILLARAADLLHQNAVSSTVEEGGGGREKSNILAPTAKLSASWFNRIIAAREQYINNNPYVNLDAVERYAEHTYSTLLYLTLQALPMHSVTIDHIASHVGKAAGIATVLRGLPLLAFPPAPNHHSNDMGLGGDVSAQRRRSRQGVVTLPLDVMAESEVREEDVLRQGAEAEGLKDAVFKVATRASDHLITARTMMQNLRKGQDVGHDFEHEQESEEHAHGYAKERGGESGETASISQQAQDMEQAFGVLMPAVSTQMWLDRLQKVDFDIFSNDLRRRDWKLPWKAYFAYRARTF